MKWIIQTAFVGDCVLTLPFLHEFARHLDAQERALLIVQKGIQYDLMKLALERSAAELGDGRIQLESLDKRGEDAGFFRMRRKIQKWRKNGDPSRVYCVQRSFRTAVIALMSGAQERIGFGSGAASYLYTHTVARSWDRGQHEIEKNLDLLRLHFDVPLWSKKGSQKSLLAAKQRPERRADRIALAVGSPWPTKRWPVENALELLDECVREGIEVVLVGDPSSKELAAEIVRQNDSLLIDNRVGQTGAQEWVDILDSCSVLVSGDSASVHVASDLGVPVLALFGPTVPDFGFAPWRRGSRVLQLPDLPCRPCHIHGPKVCPLGHHKCLKDLRGKEVFEHASYLARNAD